MRGDAFEKRPYTIEDFKRDMQIDEEQLKESIREYFLQTEEEREEYRRFINDLLLHKIPSSRVK